MLLLFHHFRGERLCSSFGTGADGAAYRDTKTTHLYAAQHQGMRSATPMAILVTLPVNVCTQLCA